MVKSESADDCVVYLRGAALWDEPMTEVVIPHSHAANGDGKEIPLYVRIPKTVKEGEKCPVVLLLTGLDGHRPDNTGVSTFPLSEYLTPTPTGTEH